MKNLLTIGLILALHLSVHHYSYTYYCPSCYREFTYDQYVDLGGTCPDCGVKLIGDDDNSLM